MKKPSLALIAATLALGILAGPSAFARTFRESGSIIAPSPARATAGTGATEVDFLLLTGDCKELPIVQGVDAWVTLLPYDFRQGTGSLMVEGDDTTGAHDMDVYFLDGSCAPMSGALTSGVDPSGRIPRNAIYAVVILAMGANATFDLTATAP